MIADLDVSLDALLRLQLPDNMENVEITFATPDRNFPPASVQLPAIDLFLYDVRENRTLRSNVPTFERSPNTVTQQRPPVRVDCSYMITAWASAETPTPALEEHAMLSAVMRVLLSWPHLPDSVLCGELKDQQLPLPATCLQPGMLQSLGEFWQALDGTPKAALSYTVTIGVLPLDPDREELPVTESVLNFSQMADQP